jgi:FMN phosphatase YigB (HAD superfamily)
MFFDDAIANVEAARTLGMQACHVAGIEDIRASLTAADMFVARSGLYYWYEDSGIPAQ